MVKYERIGSTAGLGVEKWIIIRNRGFSFSGDHYLYIGKCGHVCLYTSIECCTCYSSMNTSPCSLCARRG